MLCLVDKGGVKVLCMVAEPTQKECRMATLTTSTEVSSSLGMSHNKVKRLCRETHIRYDTNQGSYVFLREDFDNAYAKRFDTCMSKTANKKRKKTNAKKKKAELKTTTKK